MFANEMFIRRIKKDLSEKSQKSYARYSIIDPKHIEEPPSPYKRIPTTFERPRSRLQVAKSIEDLACRREKSEAIIQNLSNISCKEKENTSDLLKKCQIYFNRKISQSKLNIYRSLRRDSVFNEKAKRKAVNDYYKVRNAIDSFGKSKLLSNITGKYKRHLSFKRV